MTNPAPITRVYKAKGFDVDERNIEIAKLENLSEDQKLEEIIDFIYQR